MSITKIALVGAPNCGKSTLFNGLTGGRAKVANYPGATVETRSGQFSTPAGQTIELVDLPGIYGLTPRSMDEQVAIDLVTGRTEGEAPPDMMLVLIDASNIRTHLHSILQLKEIGRPMMVALNMIDLAERDGLKLDVATLEERLGLPVVVTQATRKSGRKTLIERLDQELTQLRSREIEPAEKKPIADLQREARLIAGDAILHEPVLNKATRTVDRVLLHPVSGPFVLLFILFFMFQAVFSWSAAPMDAIEAGAGALGDFVGGALPDNWIRSLIVDGIIAGVGSVIVFLPQILILFAFILVLEASGYMARAAFMMDELMMRIGPEWTGFYPSPFKLRLRNPGHYGRPRDRQ